MILIIFFVLRKKPSPLSFSLFKCNNIRINSVFPLTSPQKNPTESSAVWAGWPHLTSTEQYRTTVLLYVKSNNYVKRLFFFLQERLSGAILIFKSGFLQRSQTVQVKS